MVPIYHFKLDLLFFALSAPLFYLSCTPFPPWAALWGCWHWRDHFSSLLEVRYWLSSGLCRVCLKTGYHVFFHHKARLKSFNFLWSQHCVEWFSNPPSFMSHHGNRGPQCGPESWAGMNPLWFSWHPGEPVLVSRTLTFQLNDVSGVTAPPPPSSVSSRLSGPAVIVWRLCPEGHSALWGDRTERALCVIPGRRGFDMSFPWRSITMIFLPETSAARSGQVMNAPPAPAGDEWQQSGQAAESRTQWKWLLEEFS